MLDDGVMNYGGIAFAGRWRLIVIDYDVPTYYYYALVRGFWQVFTAEGPMQKKYYTQCSRAWRGAILVKFTNKYPDRFCPQKVPPGIL